MHSCHTGGLALKPCTVALLAALLYSGPALFVYGDSSSLEVLTFDHSTLTVSSLLTQESIPVSCGSRESQCKPSLQFHSHVR